MFLDGRVEHCALTVLLKAIYKTQCKPINHQWQFLQNQDKKVYNLYGNTEDPKLPKQS